MTPLLAGQLLCKAIEQALGAGLIVAGEIHVTRPRTPGLCHADAVIQDGVDVAVADLCALSWAFHDRFADLLGRRAAFNPSFAGSRDVGGADADLILDGCLIDIKTTKTFVNHEGYDAHEG